MCKEVYDVIGIFSFLRLEDKLSFLYCEVVIYEIFWVGVIGLFFIFYGLFRDFYYNGFIILKDVFFI